MVAGVLSFQSALYFNLYIMLSCYIYYVMLNCIVMVFYDIIIIVWLSCNPEILSFSSKI